MNGSPNPMGFARGKRAIAGTLVFLTFDRSSLLGHMEKDNASGFSTSTSGLKINQFYKSKNEVHYGNGSNNQNTVTTSNSFGLIHMSDQNFNALFDDTNVDSANSLRDVSSAFYADQLMPFDVFIAGSNEYGKVIKKAVIGCEILNEGSGVSVDDLVLEEQYTYIARAVTPWEKAPNVGVGVTPK